MFTQSLDISTGAQIKIQLFRNVKNTEELRKNVLSGQIKRCFINPKLIIDPFQIVVAANKALCTEPRVTKNVFSEIIFNLSITKNITRSFQEFGIRNDSSELLVVSVITGDGDDDEEVEIDGAEVELTELEGICDVEAVKKTYKISATEQKVTDLLDSIVSRIATKNFMRVTE